MNSRGQCRDAAQRTAVLIGEIRSLLEETRRTVETSRTLVASAHHTVPPTLLSQLPDDRTPLERAADHLIDAHASVAEVQETKLMRSIEQALVIVAKRLASGLMVRPRGSSVH